MQSPARYRLVLSAFVGAILLAPRSAFAGMPSIQFSDVAALRLQTISFFAVGLLLSAAGIQWLWNWLRTDFSGMPRLSYPKACGVIVLWGLLFALVLTMISGARELLTPGAWKKEGLTYRLDEPQTVQFDERELKLLDEQRKQLDRLADLLAVYAASHSGNYPESDAVADIPSARWLVPPRGELRFRYVAGLKTTDTELPLAYVPLSDGKPVPVLLAGGEITLLSIDEISRRRQEAHKP